MKKQIMSIAAIAALFTTGAMAFDYTYDGEIVADITTSSKTATGVVTGTYASYKGGEQADDDLKLSTTNRGDALVYPAFRAGDAWSSTIVVRNSKKVAVPCKVVLYAADNSRELLDFDIFLSPFDVFRFNIAADGTVSTNDGSFALIDPTLATDKHKFVKHNGDTQVIGKINARAINKNVTSGYAVIYAMAEATNVTPLVRLDADGKPALGEAGASIAVGGANGAYHANHDKLLLDFRTLTDACRGTSWRGVLGIDSADVKNGTAINTDVVAPNVKDNCLATASTGADDSINRRIAKMTSAFTTPSSDLIFGDVTISKGGEEPRNLLLTATALENYTTDNQMMLWAPGEYAAIQDRRISVDNNNPTAALKGYANNTRAGYSDYNLAGIKADSQAFNMAQAYYTFDKNELKGSNTLLITQPTKRAMLMAHNPSGQWITGTTGISPLDNKWGEFTVGATYFNENEVKDVAETGLAVVTSPVSGDPAAAYKNELQKINDPERTETASTAFQNSQDDGFAIMNIGLPALVTQMTGSVVDGKSQINWLYSTTN